MKATTTHVATMRKRRKPMAGAGFAFAMLLIAPAVHAQQSIVNNSIQNQIVETAICDGALRNGQPLPAECAKYSRYSGAKAQQPSASAAPKPPVAATRFTPVASDDSVKQFADSLGNTPEERQQILQLAAAGKELLAKKYKGKWNNTVAGAMTFFIVASYIVGTENEPTAEAEARLFDSINATLAQSEIARASNADKTALYNVLLASAGLQLVIYVDGKQTGNAAQVEQAKTMAAGFGRKILGVEPSALAGML